MSSKSAPVQASVKVTFEGDSWFLRSTMPSVVRDSASRIVASAHGDTIYPLPPGVYVIDAINFNGERESHAIEVSAGQELPLVFGTRMDRSPAYNGRPSPVSARPHDLAASRPVAVSSHVEDSFVEAMGRTPVTPVGFRGQRPAEPWPVSLLDTTECGIVSQEDGRYVFAPSGRLTRTPTVRFAIGGETWVVSLPLHNQLGQLGPETDGYPLNSANVTVERRPSGKPRLVTRFAPERRVATALDGMLGAGAVLETIDVFGQASKLLFDKYEDPPAAALGALTMHRLGRLGERERWVENLAGSRFDWFPEGKILLAALLRHGSLEDRRKGLDLLLRAAEQRPMFTDGLSLLVDLLRRWPDPESLEERRQRVSSLAALSAGADLGETCLTTVVVPERGNS